MFAACTATSTKSTRMIEERMLSRRDTSYPLFSVVVAPATVVVVAVVWVFFHSLWRFAAYCNAASSVGSLMVAPRSI